MTKLIQKFGEFFFNCRRLFLSKQIFNLKNQQFIHSYCLLKRENGNTLLFACFYIDRMIRKYAYLFESTIVTNHVSASNQSVFFLFFLHLQIKLVQWNGMTRLMQSECTRENTVRHWVARLVSKITILISEYKLHFFHCLMKSTLV